MGVPKPEPIYKDTRIKEAFQHVSDFINNKEKRSDIRRFQEKYASKSIEDVKWTDVCQDAKKFGCQKFAFIFVIYLVNTGLYCGDYQSELYSLKPVLIDIIKSGHKFNVGFLLCGSKVKDLIIYNNTHSGDDSVYSYSFIPSQNPYIKSELIDFFNETRLSTRWHIRKVQSVFEESFGDYRTQITNYTDFCANTFFEQINFFKQYRNSDECLYDSGIKIVCCFYRWLVTKYNEHDFFSNSLRMTNYLLFNNGLVELFKKDTYFTTYNPHTEYPDRRRYCFIIKGMHQLSTQLTKEDYFSVDLSNLTESFYRKLVIKYLQSATAVTTITWRGFTNYITDGLRFITRLKLQKNYPNGSLKHMNNQEAIFLRNFCHEERLSIATQNNKIGAIRRFLQWCNDSGYITFDSMFFDYLRQYEEPAKNTGSTIPDEDLVKLNRFILEDMKTDEMASLTYAVFHLLLQTEFRISQICHLTVDCIRPSIKPNEYIVYSNSKTSNGRKESSVITELTYHILMNVMDITDKWRDQCNIESLTGYIFIYPSIYNSYALYKPVNFRDYIRNACHKLQLHKTYCATNFRDTHMTKAFEHILKSGKSDLEMGILSKHKHLDTTKNHYIEIELEKMLEATYGITIGTELIETDSKVVNTIPEDIIGKDADVENGCGKCTAHSCVSTSSLPCLACKHFITTINHEIFFKKAISNLDKLIDNAKNPHDKEDLVTVKQLHVLYLKAIYKHKEGI